MSHKNTIEIQVGIGLDQFQVQYVTLFIGEDVPTRNRFITHHQSSLYSPGKGKKRKRLRKNPDRHGRNKPIRKMDL